MQKGSFPDLLLSRRKFLGLGAGALATLGLGSSAHSQSPFGNFFFEPEVRSSANGFLSSTLRATQGVVPIQGRLVNTTGIYEGSFPGPTFRIRPGDFFQVELINDLSVETNIHVHGFHVSPMTPSDNVLLHVPAGQRFTYQYTLPPDHPGGTYFYHPHLHGLAANQTVSGMAGMIIIEGDIDQIPGIAGLPERSLILQRTLFSESGLIPTFSPNGVGLPGNMLVNGILTPIMFIQPGETQRWRILDATASSLINIRIEDHPMTLIAQDGNTLAHAVTIDSLNIATAQRREVLVQGGKPGVYRVTFQDTQSPAPNPPRLDLAYLVVTGPAQTPQPLPTTLLPFFDLRSLTASKERTIRFKIKGPGGNHFDQQGFVVDDREFNPNRIDQFATLGATERWTIINENGPGINLVHPFHIHINPYQVTHINGQPFNALSYEDTTPVPVGGSITFMTRLLDFPGTWVFHCHILGHEDGGMMATLQVS